MHTAIKGLLAMLLVSTSAACVVEQDTSMAEDTSVTEATEEALNSVTDDAQEARTEGDEALSEADEVQLARAQKPADDSEQSAIYKYCFQGWTAYNDCNNYGSAGISYGYWSGYSCAYGNVYGGVCYGGYALYVW